MMCITLRGQTVTVTEPTLGAIAMAVQKLKALVAAKTQKAA